MTTFEKYLVDVFNGFVEDNGYDELFEIMFPGMPAGELVLEMYNSGMIPNDTIETFLEETE